MQYLADIERIARLGERLPRKVREADETLLMYLTCAGDYLRAGPATLKTA